MTATTDRHGGPAEAKATDVARGNAVALVDARPDDWARRFTALSLRVRSALGADVSIEHIGSTAVPELPAKDVVDALVGVPLTKIDQAGETLAAAGFVVEGRRDGHVWLSQHREGRRESIVHVVEAHGRRWERRLAFRDLLRRDPEARREYLAAKRAAAESHSSWDAYGTAKADAVQRLLAPAETSQ